MKAFTLYLALAKICLMTIIAASISACSGGAPLQHQQYDFGPLMTTSAAATVPSDALRLSLADINVPAALDSNAMLYRLQYDNAQQLKPYAQARWSMPPAQLLAQRLKLQIGQRGGLLVSSTDGVANLPVLHLELNEFSQVFTAADKSYALINVTAIVLHRHQLVAQRQFAFHVNATSADAAGGAKAMQEAVDQMIAELQHWLIQRHPE